jgi:hypothetical protein
MDKLKLYFETTLWNTYFAEPQTERYVYTRALFDGITERKYSAFISPYVIQELGYAEEPKSRREPKCLT